MNRWAADTPERPPYSYRTDPDVPAFPDDRPIIVFDGRCILCSRWARFVLRHDRCGRFRLATAQSAVGQSLYRHYGLEARDFDTNLLIQDGVPWIKSRGTIEMFRGLGPPWSWVQALRMLPTRWLDAAYTLVARNRLRWFGTSRICFIPSAEQRDRFLDPA